MSVFESSPKRDQHDPMLVCCVYIGLCVCVCVGLPLNKQ